MRTHIVGMIRKLSVGNIIVTAIAFSYARRVENMVL